MLCRDDPGMANFSTMRSVCWQWRAVADRYAPLVLAELTASNSSDAGAPSASITWKPLEHTKTLEGLNH
jgi:hypothetical protein